MNRKPRGRISLEFIAGCLIIAGTILWLLSLPCFPTTDGPVHMYYVHVLDALFSHDKPQYLHFFRIRHILPPYSLYYYALLGLSKWMPMLLADRVIICAYLISFYFGFRFLAKAIGPSYELMALLATLLTLNWPLGMGFVNFCLSLSFAFWATAVWLRIQGTGNTRARVGFLAFVTAIMLTHPVPLLLLLAVTGFILGARILHSWRTRGQLPPHTTADLVTLGLASLNLGYVKLFAVANPLKQVGDAPPYWADFIRRSSMYVREHALTPVLGRSPDIFIYRAAILIILVLAISIALIQNKRNRTAGVWTVGDSFLALGVLIFVGLPFIPSQLNGLYYFADRLMVCVWLAFLLAASGWSKPADPTIASARGGMLITPARGPFKAACIVMALLSTACLLTALDRNLRPAARAIASFSDEKLAHKGEIGFVLDDPREPITGIKQSTSWNPYYWASVNFFRENDAVLANAPWMTETIIPVQPSAALPEVSIKALQEPMPNKLDRVLEAAPDQLRSTLSQVDFYVVNQYDRPALPSPTPLFTSEGGNSGRWTCTDRETWARICSKEN